MALTAILGRCLSMALLAIRSTFPAAGQASFGMWYPFESIFDSLIHEQVMNHWAYPPLIGHRSPSVHGRRRTERPSSPWQNAQSRQWLNFDELDRSFAFG